MAVVLAGAQAPVVMHAQTIGLPDSVVVSARLPMTGTVRRSVRLAPIGISGSLVFLASDLIKRDGDPERDFIDAGQVQVSPMQVPSGPFNLTIQVGVPIRPGNYEGDLTLSVGGISETAKLIVRVEASPVVKVAAISSAHERVLCRPVVSCFVARGLVHALADRGSIPLRLERADPGTLGANRLPLNLVASQTGETQRIGEPAESIVVPEGGVAIDIALPLDEIRPDAYAGTLYLEVGGTLIDAGPVQISVRAGPLVPILLILLGVVISRAFVRIGTSDRGATDDPRFWPSVVSGFNWIGRAPSYGTAGFAMALGIPWSKDQDHTHEQNIRWFFMALLLLAALIQGLEVVYIADPTFGDNWIFDYAKALLWLFTLDMVLRGLGNLWWPDRRKGLRISLAGRPVGRSLTAPADDIAGS